MTGDFYRGRRVLVTGATGFLGANLCRRLQAEGAEVIGSTRERHGDLSEPGVAERLLDATDPDTIFHLASLVSGAQSLDVVVPVTIAGVLVSVRLLAAAAARGSRRVVLAGSMTEPEGDEPPYSAYAAAKAAQTTYVQMFHFLHGLDAVVARLFMVYGPDERNAQRFVPYVTRALLRGEPARMTRGERAIDWIYIDDAIDGLLAAGAADGVGGSRLDVGSGSLVTLRAIAEEIAQLTGSRSELRFGALPDRRIEPERVADVEETHRRIGWRPAVSIHEGLRRTVAWYRDEWERSGR